MNNQEIVKALRGVTLSNSEILEILMDLKPESVDQEDLIGRLLTTIWNSKVRDFKDSAGKYLKLLAFDEVVDKAVYKLYDSYTRWCINENLTTISKIEFSKRVRKAFNVQIRVEKINGKSVRVYRK